MPGGFWGFYIFKLQKLTGITLILISKERAFSLYVSYKNIEYIVQFNILANANTA